MLRRDAGLDHQPGSDRSLRPMNRLAHKPCQGEFVEPG